MMEEEERKPMTPENGTNKLTHSQQMIAKRDAHQIVGRVLRKMWAANFQHGLHPLVVKSIGDAADKSEQLSAMAGGMIGYPPGCSPEVTNRNQIMELLK